MSRNETRHEILPSTLCAELAHLLLPGGKAYRLHDADGSPTHEVVAHPDGRVHSIPVAQIWTARRAADWAARPVGVEHCAECGWPHLPGAHGTFRDLLLPLSAEEVRGDATPRVWL